MRRNIWCLTAAIVTTLIFGSVYVSFQQIGRHTANMAPAAAAAAQLQHMGSDVTAGPRLELTPDSGIFLIVYDEGNVPISTTVTLHGTVPSVPDGVLQTARSLGTDTVTWQPEPNLRMAIVAKEAAGKVVVAGQSLAPFEASDRMTLTFLALGWLGGLLVIAGACAALTLVARRPGRRQGAPRVDPA
ncbi:hypothetical protein [Arthrobacter sp. SLBN-112]|uniref:hypothetical protein n=1 Tax=Arthrobacter sp. SLBN-112 TaxID=2768452 RepID=UPI0027B41A65|nr:hypothetical protein [Arthrobacter sp. SLBN-112]MDQ0801385.1 hypothetical protein [Arthrobacter sp. SLBN-112]